MKHRVCTRVGLAIVALVASGCGTKFAAISDVFPNSDGGSPAAADGGALPSADGGTTTPPAMDGGTVADGGAVEVDAGSPPADGGNLACLPETNKRRLRILPVVNGTRSPTVLPLDAAQQNAVIGLAFDAMGGADCSGTLIADRTVLTAKHCTEGETASSLYVIFGINDESPALRVRVAQKREHPSHDISLLTLPESPSASIDVRPIPIALEDLTNADIGITVEQAGYGQIARRGGTDGRYFVAERLAGFESEGDVLVVDGMGQRGVCYGDSGGPSMRISPAGDARVLGVLSWGDPTCVDQDRFARIDLVRSWIEETTGATPGAGPQPCGSLTAEGSCNETGTQATFCEGDIRQHVVCPDGQNCAWSPAASGYRCLATTSDPCAGVTHFGTCGDDGTLRWCDRNVLRERNCNACGERCTVVDATTGNACRPSTCGNLTFQGRCDGNTAEWCNREGQRETLDCASRGQTCGFVNPEIGYYCISGSGCGSVDYRGSCAGQVAVWCEDGRVRRRDCAARSQVCRLVDETTGYRCAAP